MFEADAPNPELLPQDDVVGVTALLLTCKYNDQLFLKVGYFVSVEYSEEELREQPPTVVNLEKLERCVKTDDVRVNYYTIKWENAAPAEEVFDEEEEQDENVNTEKENDASEEVPAEKLQNDVPIEAAAATTEEAQ
uniref:Anti-silencing function protein 1 n=1 Tax=Steinernema glaseri TaxID=37863 RepID=A0A1I7YZY2_9BILA